MPEPSKSSDGQMSEDVRALLGLLLLLGGSPEDVKEGLCPLKTFLWSKEASAQII
jgi:hypothetical protein